MTEYDNSKFVWMPALYMFPAEDAPDGQPCELTQRKFEATREGAEEKHADKES